MSPLIWLTSLITKRKQLNNSCLLCCYCMKPRKLLHNFQARLHNEYLAGKTEAYPKTIKKMAVLLNKYHGPNGKQLGNNGGNNNKTHSGEETGTSRFTSFHQTKKKSNKKDDGDGTVSISLVSKPEPRTPVSSAACDF